jgi:hypothetical protein
MRLKRLNHFVQSVVLSVVGILTFIPLQSGYAQEERKFYCDLRGNVPLTIVNTSRGPVTFIKWVVGFENYSLAERCRITSDRLERYYNGGRIYFKLHKNTSNSQPVICITNRKHEECTNENVLVTLQKNANAQEVLERIIAFRNGAGSTLEL